MAEPFPEEVKRFILDHITSVEQLEMLLLLRGAPDQDWTGEAVGQALYTSPTAASTRLADLARQSFVTASGDPKPTYRYAPTPEKARLMDRLADTYKERRVAVITLIYSKPSDQVQAFADAFRLRKEP